MKELVIGLMACFAAMFAWPVRGATGPIERVDYDSPQDPKDVRTATFAVG